MGFGLLLACRTLLPIALPTPSATCRISRSPGIIFKDITPLLGDGALFKESIDLFLEACRGLRPDKIVGIDARGFLFGSAVAYQLGHRDRAGAKEREAPLHIAGGLLLAGVRRGDHGDAHRCHRARGNGWC